MDKSTRSELVKTVETQKGQIEKYQNKLRDLIVAYKSVVKEKDALEASLQALSSTPSNTVQLDESTSQVTSGEEDTNSSFSDPLRETKDDSKDNAAEVVHLREQLVTITASLATLTQEKSKMESNFFAEKKALKQEHEEFCERTAHESERHQRLVSDLRGEVAEWRAQVMVQQHEREREQQEHGTRVRELQRLLTQERAARDSLENQLDELKQALAEARQMAPAASQRYEDQIRALSGELEAVQRRLKLSEDTASRPSPFLLQLQEEMAEMKAQHRIAVQREQARANEAEQQLQQTDQQGEERVASLEAKLSELSDVVGNYERLRFQDQTAIHKLRERVTQLDLENTALARAAHKGTSVEEAELEDDSQLDVQVIMDKITQLKGRLKLANERSEKPVDIDELLRTGELSDLGSDSHHHRCVEEYNLLKEEFERYKLRAQSVLKNKSTKDTGSKEADTLKAQLSEVKDKLRQVLEDQEETQREHKRASDDLRKTITALQERHQTELATQAAEYKSKMTELEMEIRRHRDRTIALLAEKASEIESLKAKLPESFETRYMTSYRNLSAQSSLDSEDVSVNAASALPAALAPQSLVEQEAAVSELLKRTSLGGTSPSATDTSLLHFAQEQARKDVEIQMLRKQKHSLESALRELQRTAAQKEESHGERVEILEEQIRRLQRLNASKDDTANLEYLKNVIYHYMVCPDMDGKKSMLNAIATILQFSPREKDSVRRLLSSGWWSSGSSYTSSSKGPVSRV